MEQDYEDYSELQDGDPWDRPATPRWQDMELNYDEEILDIRSTASGYSPDSVESCIEKEDPKREKGKDADEDSGQSLSVRDIIKKFNSALEPASSAVTPKVQKNEQLSAKIQKPKGNKTFTLVEMQQSLVADVKRVTPCVKEMVNKFEASRDADRTSVNEPDQPNQVLMRRDIERLTAGRVEGSCNGSSTKEGYINYINALRYNNEKTLIASAKNSTQDDLPLCKAVYDSKTTVARTSKGIRITIDLNCDQGPDEVNKNIGKRFETDIPHSTILAEFQQKSSFSKLLKSEPEAALYFRMMQHKRENEK